MEVNSFLEIIAVATALIYIFLAAKSNRWCFLFGLISSAIYIYITFELAYYFDVLINTYYVGMSFYGWIEWGKTNQSTISIKQMSKKLLIILLSTCLILSISMAFVISQFSNASLPYLDAITTFYSLLATWMVVKKYIENWVIWIAIDFIAAGMYFYKELYLTGLLFLVYSIIAIFGYRNWKKQLSYD